MTPIRLPLLALTAAAIAAGPALISGAAAQQAPGGQRSPGAQQQQQPPGQPSQQGLGETEARAMIEAHGYSNVEQLQPDGDGFTASAERDGEPVRVSINSRGQVSESGS